MPDVRIGYRPFPEQQAYFRRKVNMPSERWDDLKHGEHAHGFMAAGVARADVLDEIRGAVQAAIDDGEGYGAFQARFEDIVRRHGWPGGAGNESDARRAWRMRTIYQTNLRTSYMAGRWQELQAFPFLRYQHNTVANPREQHLAWNGLVLASDDPWWDTHYPPNGWGCRCTVTGVGKGRMRVLGKDGPDPTPEPGEGDPPPEWAYHPGKAARSLPAAEAFGRKVMGLPPEWRQIALDDAQRRRVDWFADYPSKVDDVAESLNFGRAPRTDASFRSPIGFFPTRLTDAIERGVDSKGRSLVHDRSGKPMGELPRSVLLAIKDERIAHALRDKKVEDRPGLRDVLRAGLRSLPEWLGAEGTRVLWQKSPQSLVFARPMGNGGFMTAVFATDPRAPGALWLRTMEVESDASLRGLQHVVDL